MASLLSIFALAGYATAYGIHAGREIVGDETRVFTVRAPVSLVRLAGGNASAAADVRFRLPARMDSVASGWYRLDARVRMVVADTDNEPGSAEIDVGVNGHSGIQLNLDGRTLDLLRGAVWGSDTLMQGFLFGGLWTRIGIVRISDYLPAQTVHSGENKLYLREISFSGRLLSEAAILRGTDVVYSRLGPARLHLLTHPERITVSEGEKFGVQYSIINEGLPALEVALVVGLSGGGIGVLGSPTRFLGIVAAHNDGEIQCVALVPGGYRIILWAQGRTGTGALGGLVAYTSVRVMGPHALLRHRLASVPIRVR